ncbi:MAG: hypothetical protein AAF934_05410, partial [Bacteroidota bacterium]
SYLNSARGSLENAKAILSQNDTIPDDIDPSDRKLYHLKGRLETSTYFDHRPIEDIYGNNSDYREAIALLNTGNYSNHFFQGTAIDLSHAESLANAHNEGDNRILIQSVFDAEVAGKKTIIDEYATVVNLSETGIAPHDFLMDMARDMSGTLGGEFDDLGEFKNLGHEPEIGQVIDIDVEDGPRIFGKQIPFTESPFNAPVMITNIQENSFTVQTIEFNGNEHVLHGTREWGFEEMGDGNYRFYTRGVSVEDIQAAEGTPFGNAKDGERRFWNAWIDGVENHVTGEGGTVVEGSRIANQTSGPTGNEIWDTLPQEQQDLVKDSQVSGLEREIERIDEENPKRTHASRKYENEINTIKDKISDWEAR